MLLPDINIGLEEPCRVKIELRLGPAGTRYVDEKLSREEGLSGRHIKK